MGVVQAFFGGKYWVEPQDPRSRAPSLICMSVALRFVVFTPSLFEVVEAYISYNIPLILVHPFWER